MDEFHAFTHHVINVARDLCTELMYDWLSELDLYPVKDDLQNRKAAFSFVHHPDNHHPDNHRSEAYFSLSTKAYTAGPKGLMTHGS
jgi:hypothetical protein